MSENLNVAVVTGSHPYDVVNFQKMFTNFPDITIYPQHMEDFVTDTGEGRDMYDVVLFYHMFTETPGSKETRFNQQMEEVLSKLGNTPQGIFILHHSVVGFPDWELWSQICGIANRVNDEVFEGVEMEFEIEDDSHFITKGLTSWSMEDEVYTIDNANSDDNNILITTNHPKSMKTIAWTRKYKKARVFCFSAGHDNQAFSNPNFQEVVKRGIIWTANNN